MTGGRHLSSRALADLSATQREPRPAEARHLERCPACRLELALWLDMVRTLQGPALRAGAAPLARVLSRLPQVVPPRALRARLRQPGPRASHRECPTGRGSTGGAHDWVFRFADRELSVQAFADGAEERSLYGQVLGPAGPEAGLAVHLRHGRAPQTTFTDHHGEFSLSGVQGPRVALLVETDQDVYWAELGPVAAPEMEEPGDDVP